MYYEVSSMYIRGDTTREGGDQSLLKFYPCYAPDSRSIYVLLYKLEYEDKF